MKKIIISIIVIGLLLTTSIVSVNAVTCRLYIYVDDDADPDWYDETHVKTINEGIEVAEDGDTVYVFNGTYTGTVVIDKSIILKGENKDTTVLEGKIKIDKVDGATVCGFTIKKGCPAIWVRFSSNIIIAGNSITDNTGDGSLVGGIDLWSSDNNIIMDNTITNNTAEDHFYGIHIMSSSYNTISGNTIANNTAGDSAHGINLLGLFNNTIVGNTIANNIGDIRGSIGIDMIDAINTTILNNIITDHVGGTEVLDSRGIDVGFRCYGNTISGNIIADNTGAGIALGSGYSPHNNTISGNTITGSLYGIWFCYGVSDMRDNIIFANDISDNDFGILLKGCCNNNIISANNISDNNNRGIYLVVAIEMSGEKYYPNDNNIYYNNFENNGGIVMGRNAKDEGSNTWDDGEAMGNYWDDYIGWDLFPRDGIGDIPYDIPDEDNQDRFPLMGLYPDVHVTFYSDLQANPTLSQQSSSNPSSQYQGKIITEVTSVDLAESEDYRPRDRIDIDGNDEFNEANGVESGSGTEADPYIIEWWELPSIHISHTTAYFIIRHCYLYGSNFNGEVNFRNVENGKVQDCIIEGDGRVMGFFIIYANNILIEYCTLSNCHESFHMKYCNNSIIRNCTISDCDDGFDLGYSNNNIIHNCEIVNLDSKAFDLGYSDNNTIYNCTISDCDEGIELGRSNNNIIYNCEIVNCVWDGFDMFESNNNIIHTCNLSGDESDDGWHGFILAKCSGNTIYHNNIINFQINAITDECDANQWDDGEGKGNYWDDYIGLDIDRDGIGDRPYIILFSTGNRDRYPLMGPYPDAYSNNQNSQPSSQPSTPNSQQTTSTSSTPSSSPKPTPKPSLFFSPSTGILSTTPQQGL